MSWMVAVVVCGGTVCLAQAQPLPRAPIEVQVPVKSIQDKRVVLNAGWQQQLAVGMVLNLLDSNGAVSGLMKLTQVNPNQASGEIVAEFSPTVSLIASRFAVAPTPLPLTAINGNSFNFALPRGNRVLKPGSTLAVWRDNNIVAVAQFTGYSPIAATVVWQKPGTELQIGDVARIPLASEQLPAEAQRALSATSVQRANDLPAQSTLTPAVVPVVAPPNSDVFAVPGGQASGSTAALASSSAQENTTSGENLTGTLPSSSPEPAGVAANAGTDVFAAPQQVVSPVPKAPRRYAAVGQNLSRNGATGLIRMPSADVLDDGKVAFSAFGDTKSPDLRRVGNSQTYAGAIGFLPRVEIGATVGNERQNKDLTFNAKLQVVREKRNRPAVAVGVTEVKKLANGGPDPAFYAAIGKSFLSQRVRVTGGVLHRNPDGNDIFGGIEVGLTRQIAAVVEHDSQDLNYGVRASLFKDRAHVAAQKLEGKWTYSVGFNLALGNRQGTTAPIELPRLGASLDVAEAARTMQRQLVELGLENVAVRVWETSGVATSDAVSSSDAFAGATTSNLAPAIEVVYENRSFPHNEMDALANVLATVATYAPSQAQVATVIIQRSAVPIIRITCPLEEYRRFMSGQSDAKTFGEVFEVSYDVTAPRGNAARLLVDTGTHARSYGHADLSLRPGLRTQLATDFFIFGAGISLQPELDLPIARGLGFNARADIPLAGPLKPDKTTIDRVALNYSAKLGKSLLSRTFVGRFPTERDGVWTELLVTPERSRLQGRLAGGYLNDSPGSSNRIASYLGEGRYYLPKYDLTARVSGGRYIDGDSGATAALIRRYGDTEVGLEVRDTTRGQVGLVQLGIPLGPKYLSSKPDAFRLRPPDFLNYSQRSLLRDANFLDIINSIGSEPAVGSDATRSLLDRDRLNRAYLLRWLPELRNIAPFQAP